MKPQKIKRTIIATFRISEPEFEILKNNAKKKGMTVSRYIRYKCVVEDM